MEIVENTLNTDLDAFLDRPLFCHLAQTSEAGPRVSPLWFLWDGDVIWIIAQLKDRSYPNRVEQDSRTAISIVDFDQTSGLVEHVGMRGHATLEPYDEDNAECLLKKYLGEKKGEWPERFVGLDEADYRLIKFVPETVVARDQSYLVTTRAD